MIESYMPERPEYEAVALYIWGDHMYTVSDPATKRAIIKEPTSEARSQEKEVLGTIGRRPSHNIPPNRRLSDLGRLVI